ncbi:hypothetical protein Dimus_025410 [Dionaea muscipula]
MGIFKMSPSPSPMHSLLQLIKWMVSLICFLQLLQESLSFDVGCLEEEENAALGLSYAQLLLETHSCFRFEELLLIHEDQEQEQQASPHSFTTPGVNVMDKMSFLEMLQCVESPLHIQEPPNLLRLQQQKKQKQVSWENSSSYLASTEQQQLESCVTNDMMELASPVKSKHQIQPHQNQGHQNQQTYNNSQSCNLAMGRSKQAAAAGQLPKSPPPATRKRKRTRPLKNKEEVETQRMTHIAVERNRRRQMNDHLSALRSLIPSSHVQRGDQASIIGGAIDFVKELEQLLQSLQAKKRMRMAAENAGGGGDASAASSSSSSSTNILFGNHLFKGSSSSSLQDQDSARGSCGGRREELAAEKRSPVAEIEAVVIHNHVNLKIESPRRAGQLVSLILALQDLRLTVLHLNITSFQAFLHYSFNLKVPYPFHFFSFFYFFKIYDF